MTYLPVDDIWMTYVIRQPKSPMKSHSRVVHTSSACHMHETSVPRLFQVKQQRTALLNSRHKVQKLRGQSQYISKNVRALQYWRWACGTCCKQYHMLFYIQMAVVSTAIFFLFSPSFLKYRSKYIYISTINANTSTNSLQNLKFTELRRNQYPPSPCPQGYYTSYTLKCH